VRAAANQAAASQMNKDTKAEIGALSFGRRRLQSSSSVSLSSSGIAGATGITENATDVRVLPDKIATPKATGPRLLQDDQCATFCGPERPCTGPCQGWGCSNCDGPSSTPINTDGHQYNGEIKDADGVRFEFNAVEGVTYQLDTETGTLLDTVMQLVGADGTTIVAENDDDERVTGRMDSYIEWTCETSGLYYVDVKGYDSDIGTFTLSISEPSVGGGPCDGGVHMTQEAAVISFRPEGKYASSLHCVWSMACSNPSDVVTLSFEIFDTEALYDFVNLYDGDSTEAGKIRNGRLHGKLTDMTQREFTSSGPAMAIAFTTDAEGSADGFEASYSCEVSSAPRPGRSCVADDLSAITAACSSFDSITTAVCSTECATQAVATLTRGDCAVTGPIRAAPSLGFGPQGTVSGPQEISSVENIYLTLFMDALHYNA
jgi:hypothetical protein